MSVVIGFIGGACLNVDESYAHVVTRDWQQPFEVTLADGMYGRRGTKMRLTVNPAGIAYVRDQEGAP